MPHEPLELKAADVVVRNEGEITFYELIQRFKNNESLDDLKGISFLKDGHVVHNPERELLADLDELPPFPYHLFEKDIAAYQFGNMLTSRGCPYSCIFCSQKSISGRRYRTRSAPKVIEVNFNLADQRARQNGLLDLCANRQAGCIIRTPLCFGFLTGQFAADTAFGPADHRRRWSHEQRQRWADAGRAFSAAVTPVAGQTPAQVALRFCLSYPGVSTAIPGMLTASHVDDNAGASCLGPLSLEERRRIEELYEQHRFFLSGGRNSTGDSNRF